MNNPLEYIALVAIITGALYVAFNIYFQRTAEYKLEKLLRNHRVELLQKMEKLKDAKSKHNHIELADNEFELQSLLMLLREQIELLEKRDKFMLKKTFESKDSDNQIRYAVKLFGSSGLSELFKFNKTTNFQPV